MWGNVQDRITKAMANIKNALIGKITSVVKGSNEVFIELSDDDEIRDAKIITPYGFYSLPKSGQYGQIIYNNSTKKVSLIGIDNRNKKPLSIDVGEVLIYNGLNYIVLKNNNEIEITTDNIKIKSNSTSIESNNINISASERISIDAPKGVAISATDITGSGVTINGKLSSGSW